MNNSTTARLNTKKLCYAGVMTCMTVVCSWISIPMTVSFTLQTFAVAFAAYFLGLGYGLLSLAAYVLLGICGVPVFANFRSGISVITGATGGYIIGFFLMMIIIGVSRKIWENSSWKMFVFGMIGILADYLVGTLWFYFVYLGAGKSTTILYVLEICVFPFMLVDAVKILLAVIVSKKLRKVLQ